MAGLTTGGAALIGGGLAASTDTTDDVELIALTVAVPNLPPAFEGYRIGFITDTHLGSYVLTTTVHKALSLLAAAKPSLLIYGGDYGWLPERDLIYPVRNPEFAGLSFEDRNRAVYARLAALNQTLQPADGSVGVMGNHDRWVAPATCIDVLSRGGIDILVNKDHTIKRGDATLSVFGVDDYWTGVPRLPTATTTSAEVKILVAHNPDYVADQITRGDIWWHLALCGHTHGGQICLPFIGPVIYNVVDHRYAEGKVACGPASLVYTSRGIGVVEIPKRINCRPEVTVVTLTAAA